MQLPPALARWLAAQGHDALHVAAIGMDRSPDAAILARAEAESRTVAPADLDFPRLLALSGAAGPSLILFRGGNWAEAEVVQRL